MAEIVFHRDPICKRLGISKEVFYKLTEEPGSSIKQIGGAWVCNLDELAEWIRTYNLKPSQRQQSAKRGGQ